ncbi:MAG: radical SAM protein [Elusimicrobiota bacterium]|nr:radical SAM protein [Elusimicrobiota bacterium]
MTDSFGRKISYLRISLTDRCNLRCRYCMGEEGITNLSHSDILTYEEILRMTEIFRTLGVEKFRFTGGEPFARKGVMDFFEKLDFPFHITTNLTMPALDIGRINGLNIASINVSCDSLEPEKYRFITRCGQFETFLENFRKLRVKNKKLNVVLIKNFNDDEALDFIKFAAESETDVRFIEKMDFLNDNLDFAPLPPLEKNLIDLGIIEEESFNEPGGVARYHKMKNSNKRVGFISSMTEPFCGRCGKIRIKANGDAKLCLFDEKSFNIRNILKNGNDGGIRDFIYGIIQKKGKFPDIRRGMEPIAQIGG